MGQASNRSDAEALDLVLTNCVIIDWQGIIKVGNILSIISRV
jgi:urease